MLRRQKRFSPAILLILLTLLLGSCSGVETPYQDRVIKEYFLKDAGFWQLDANTPKRQELMASMPKGQFVSYRLDGEKYYAYAAGPDRVLYIGNEAAYQKYLSMVRDKKLCQSLDATDWGPFWACFEEFQKGGKAK